jgi:hypothetical protein
MQSSHTPRPFYPRGSIELNSEKMATRDKDAAKRGKARIHTGSGVENMVRKGQIIGFRVYSLRVWISTEVV